MSGIDARCCRCGRQTSQLSDEFTEWEVLGDGTDVVCPGCLTAEEQQAIYDDWREETARLMACCSRCGRDRPEGEGLEEGWLIAEDGPIICPGCTSHRDRMDDMQQTIEGLGRCFGGGQEKA